MAIEELPSGGLVITGTEDINTYALLTLASALAFKINTGMEMSRIPALQGAKNLGIIPKDKRGNAKTALKLTVQRIREGKPGYEPSGTIAKALAK